MSHISYSDDELTIPTFYCSECKTDTVGFSICLKCNPQTYTVGKPDVIKAALSVGITDFDRARIGYDKMNVYEREIWNGAIEAAANEVAEVHQEQIRKLKK